MMVAHADYHDLERSLLVLLDAVKALVCAEDLEWVRQFLDHGEYGVALQELVDVILDETLRERRRISVSIYESILELAAKMEMESEDLRLGELRGNLEDL